VSDELRVGILGAGLIGGVHVEAYAMTPGTTVVAVADPVEAKAQRLAAGAGAAVVADLEGMLDLGVDVVSVCTPPSTHADIAVAALESGAHVLCEKPLARTVADGRRIVEAADRAEGLLMVGHVSRFEPDHRMAKQLVDQGLLGPVRMVKHSITSALPGWSEAGWLADSRLSGGPLLDVAVHSFDYLAWLLDCDPIRVHTVGADTGAGPATYALATLRFASGAMALVEVSWAHPAARGTKLAAELVGPLGRLTWSYDHMMAGVLYPDDGDPTWFDTLGDRGYRDELRSFADAIRSGATSPVPARDGFAAIRTALAAMESLRTGETIDLTTWEAP
jgi:myo-inositol 2-dehydrogenase/D-chiro-inositol 1-dehydrogenase